MREASRNGMKKLKARNRKEEDYITSLEFEMRKKNRIKFLEERKKRFPKVHGMAEHLVGDENAAREFRRLLTDGAQTKKSFWTEGRRAETAEDLKWAEKDDDDVDEEVNRLLEC